MISSLVLWCGHGLKLATLSASLSANAWFLLRRARQHMGLVDSLQSDLRARGVSLGRRMTPPRTWRALREVATLGWSLSRIAGRGEPQFVRFLEVLLEEYRKIELPPEDGAAAGDPYWAQQQADFVQVVFRRDFGLALSEREAAQLAHAPYIVTLQIEFIEQCFSASDFGTTNLRAVLRRTLSDLCALEEAKTVLNRDDYRAFCRLDLEQRLRVLRLPDGARREQIHALNGGGPRYNWLGLRSWPRRALRRLRHSMDWRTESYDRDWAFAWTQRLLEKEPWLRGALDPYLNELDRRFSGRSRREIFCHELDARACRTLCQMARQTPHSISAPTVRSLLERHLRDLSSIGSASAAN